jgi:E1A/CREB-binding protein
MGGNITIRQVTSMDRKLDVRERMRSRYGFKNYPAEFPFRCKCIIVFQNLDGVDVILFGLYVYEHGADCPPPNNRAVYISYLDSVHYMRPRKMRTFIYHEILISYLDYVRNKGFLTAHIWACPPLKGDDYILYAKPEDQKTPKDDRLRQWYIDMLIEAQKRDIVGKLTNMYDLYFADERNDATVVPYMDGDYFPAEVENVIKDIEEGKGSKSSDSGKKNKKKAKAKQKGNRGGTRSTGLDEEALKASGILPLGIDSKSLEEGARDFVMKKVGETIQPMKESFIVAFLNSTSPDKHTDHESNTGEMQTDKSSQEKRSDLKTQPCPTDAASSLSSSSRAPVDVKPVQSAAENGLNTDSLEKVNCEPLVSLSNGNAPTPSSNVVKTENSVDSKGKINMNYVQCSLCTLLLLLCKHLLYLSR